MIDKQSAILAGASYSAHKEGDHLSDGDLHNASLVMPVVAETLRRMGPEFGLAERECRIWGEDAGQILRTRREVAQERHREGVQADIADALGIRSGRVQAETADEFTGKQGGRVL